MCKFELNLFCFEGNGNYLDHFISVQNIKDESDRSQKRSNELIFFWVMFKKKKRCVNRKVSLYYSVLICKGRRDKKINDCDAQQPLYPKKVNPLK